MKAKCVCPKHGRLKMNQIIIDDRIPKCKKCKSVLEYAEVRPRKVKK